MLKIKGTIKRAKRTAEKALGLSGTEVEFFCIWWDKNVTQC